VRLAEFRRGTHPARADDEENLRENQIAQSQRLFERGALLFNIAFCAIEFANHAPNCRACASLAHRKLAGGAPALQLRNNLILVRLLRWRLFVAKFAMPDFAAGVRNVSSGSQCRCGDKNYGNDEWC